MTEFVNDKQQVREQRIAAAKRAKLLRRAGGLAVAAILIAGGIYLLARSGPRASEKLSGATFPDQGREHVVVGTPFQYNSNPPTSGPHAGNPAEWGLYSEEFPDQVLIHNLEHGGIWISYRPGVDAAIISKLEVITREFGRKVIMAPRAANDADIALAAWTHLDTFSVAEFSEERVRKFIQVYRNKGPEFVP